MGLEKVEKPFFQYSLQNSIPGAPGHRRGLGNGPTILAILAGRETGRLAPTYDSFRIFYGGKSGYPKEGLVFIPRPRMRFHSKS